MFKLVKEIKSKEGVLHFRRYRIFETPWLSLFLHKIYQSDMDCSPHNHPWSFINFVLRGSYLEEVWDAKEDRWFFSHRVLNFGIRRRHQFHRNTVIEGPVVSLFLTGPRSKEEWGYLHSSLGFMNHKDYRERKNELEKLRETNKCQNK